MDDREQNESEIDDEPIWLAAASTVQSLLLAVAFFMLIPWYSYYKNTLLWDDSSGLAVFFGVIAVLNALSLVVRAKAVDVTNAKWNQLTNRNVAMCGSYLANTLFWGGMAIWCVYRDLGVSRPLCYLITATGTFGHTALYAMRWQLTKAKSDGLITTVYGVLSVVITLAFLSGDDWF